MNKFEKCVLKVKEKQPKSCEKSKWKEKGCYNPWAICNKSVGKPRSVGRPKKPCKSGFLRDKITKRCRKSRRKSRKSRRKSVKGSRRKSVKPIKSRRKSVKGSRRKSRKP
jgi:hypothetical protein